MIQLYANKVMFGYFFNESLFRIVYYLIQVVLKIKNTKHFSFLRSLL